VGVRLVDLDDDDAVLVQVAREPGRIGAGRRDRDHLDRAEAPQPGQQRAVAAACGREPLGPQQRAALIERSGLVRIGVRVDAADDNDLAVLHAVRVVLSIPKGGPVGTGGHNTDEALVASRFL
jgi:hypothetical protein